MFKYGIVIIGSCCAVLTACAHHKPYGDELSVKNAEGIYHRSVSDEQEHAATGAEGGAIARQGRNNPGQDANQRLVDTALELYQKSQDYWDRGDLEHALDALDESYALIGRVDQDVDESILQQKEDLRYTIAKRIMEVYASRLSAVNGPHDA